MKKVNVLRKKYPRFVYEGYSYRISDKKRTGKITADLEIFFDFRIAPNYEPPHQNWCGGENSSPSHTNFGVRARNISFHPKIIVKNVDKKRLGLIGPPASLREALRAGDRVLDNFVFHLGLMEIPSYWKAVCSPKIEIKAGYLNKEQIKWWKDFIMRGMGQFFYENKIDFRKPNFLKIISNQAIEFRGDPFSASLAENGSPSTSMLARNKFLIPMGEGKDSIVTLELLKNDLFKKTSLRKQLNCFIVNPKKTHFKILKIAKINNPIIVERKIDPLLPKLNQKGTCPACPERSRREPAEGFLNGHTPITGVISNLAIFAAVLFGYGNVSLSCERSANEGNLQYLGKTINHQWSKSFEFEQKFRKYITKYLAKDINYFSFLRPLYEIQIAKIFSQFPQYFSCFLSCNEARKTKSRTKKPTDKWCGKCSKCLFVFTILYPFLKGKKLVKIFNENLFEKKELLPIMKELIGESKYKPLECVGTKKECLAAFFLSYKKYISKISIGDTYGNLPVLLKYFQNKILPKYPKLKLENKSKKILNSWNNQNNLPKILDRALKKAYKEKKVHFRQKRGDENGEKSKSNIGRRKKKKDIKIAQFIGGNTRNRQYS